MCTQIANTIEGRILQIQKRKTAIVKEAFRGKGASGADSESMENLKIMFGDDWSAFALILIVEDVGNVIIGLIVTHPMPFSNIVFEFISKLL